MFCIKCGKTFDSSVSVCPDCGAEVVLPGGFDLNNAKKTMNGRSILIDDSPLPGTVPAYLASASVPKAQFAPCFAAPEKQPQNKKTLVILVAAAVFCVALIAVILILFLGEDKEEKRKSIEDNYVTVAETEIHTDEDSKKSDKEDFISDKTGVNIIGNEETTNRFFNGLEEFNKENGKNENDESSTRQLPGNRPPNPFSSEDRTDPDNMNDSGLNDMLNGKPDEPVDSENGIEDNFVPELSPFA